MTEDCQVPFAFNGVIEKIRIDLGDTPEADRVKTDEVQEENWVKKAMSD